MERSRMWKVIDEKDRKKKKGKQEELKYTFNSFLS